VRTLGHYLVPLCLIALIATSLEAVAQTPQTSATRDMTFEVASVRPVEWRMDCRTVMPSGSTHWGVTCRNLLDLIAMAWNIKGDDIQGGERSALMTFYDVRATLPGNKTWSDFDTVRPMLRQLLMERFHLSVHSASRKEAGYGLFAAKSGVKLKPADHSIYQDGEKPGARASNWIDASHVQGRGQKISQIATLFSLVLRVPVIDHTGLPGVYDVDLDFAPVREVDPSDKDSLLPSFFGAVEDELGLKLHPEQVIVPILVIDHVDRFPTPN
jgi:uncharacterized protein (TIGR03435 family)